MSAVCLHFGIGCDIPGMATGRVVSANTLSSLQAASTVRRVPSIMSAEPWLRLRPMTLRSASRL